MNMSDPKRYEYTYDLRKVDSARVHIGRRVDGRLEARIAHAPLRGVTSEMLVWWFENFADGPAAIEADLSTRKTARVGGKDVPLYWLWHPIDHFMVRITRPAPNGAPGLSEGARVILKETILETIEMNGLIDGMNRDGVHLTLKRGPFRLGDLRHTFVDTEKGLEYRSRLIAGSTLPVVGRLINRIVHRVVFSPAMMERWLQHNVEEVGAFENFLPALFAQRERAEFRLEL
jgi:hypothetical protein